MMACLNDHAPITKLLLGRGCTVNAAYNVVETALYHACRLGFTECVKELLAHHGADTSIKSSYGKTPLDIAKENKHQAVIDLLLVEHKNSP